MKKLPSVLVLPGLRDNVKLIEKFVTPIQNNFHIIMCSAQWETNETHTNKLQRLCHELRNADALIAISASGHIGIELLTLKEAKNIKALGVISARLRCGKNIFPTARQSAWRHPLFYDSLIRFEDKILPYIDQKVKNKIMTTSGTYDWIVPPMTSMLEGATNVIFQSNRLNMLNHMENIKKGIQSHELRQFFLKKLS